MVRRAGRSRCLALGDGVDLRGFPPPPLRYKELSRKIFSDRRHLFPVAEGRGVFGLACSPSLFILKRDYTPPPTKIGGEGKKRAGGDVWGGCVGGKGKGRGWESKKSSNVIFTTTSLHDTTLVHIGNRFTCPSGYSKGQEHGLQRGREEKVT